MADLNEVIRQFEAQHGPLSALDRIAADARRHYRQLAPSLPVIEDSLSRAVAAMRDLPAISPPREYIIPSHLDRLSITRKEG